ncbi:MAG: WYL domain-containing protein [Ruminococcaceae bacterium]|nr:WYL domain-containing protein [Oscillospiraceae bacterium]
MARYSSHRLKLLVLKEMFEKLTDEQNGVELKQIIEYLAKKGIPAERKSIYSDIALLRDFGMDIITEKGTKTTYKLVSREFQLPELKLLVDSVSSSKFITRKKSLDLISKLEKLTSKYEARELRRQVYVEKRVKTMNESIYYNVDSIHTAIAKNKKLNFKYFEYDRERKKVFRRKGETYSVSPLALIYSDENYYLTAFCDRRSMIVNYRVDRMSGVSLSNEDRISNDETSNFDPAIHQKSQFSMFAGDVQNVKIEFDNSLSTLVIDRFGSDVFIYPEGDEHFIISIDIEVSPAFFGWIFMLGDKAKILEPKSLSDEFLNAISAVAKSYVETK